MPAQSDIGIADEAATPVTHTFAVAGAMNEAGEFVARWINRTASTLASGAERMLMAYRDKKDLGFRARCQIVMPTTEVVAGVATVTRSNTITITVDCAANSTEQERKNLLAMARGAIGDGEGGPFRDVVVSGSPMY